MEIKPSNAVVFVRIAAINPNRVQFSLADHFYNRSSGNLQTRDHSVQIANLFSGPVCFYKLKNTSIASVEDSMWMILYGGVSWLRLTAWMRKKQSGGSLDAILLQ